MNCDCIKRVWVKTIIRYVCHAAKHLSQNTLKAKIMIEFTEGIYNFYVYILTNKAKTVLYTGVTNNLRRRLEEHNEKLNPNSFSAKCNLNYLIYYEKYGWIQQAIAREKEIKLLRRDLKLELIKEFNPNMEFLNNHFS